MAKALSTTRALRGKPARFNFSPEVAGLLSPLLFLPSLLLPLLLVPFLLPFFPSAVRPFGAELAADDDDDEVVV
jgi:hypothetical protein